MRIIPFKAIKDYVKENANTRVALGDWYSRTKRADWHSLMDIKRDFNSVDYVGNDRYVFNIKGNHYRLVAIIVFASQKVYIRFIGSHKEYDKIKANKI